MMGKRPRTPHFITGIGDGSHHDISNNVDNDDVFRLRGNVINKNKKERTDSTAQKQNNRYDSRNHRLQHNFDEKHHGDTAVPDMDMDLNNMNIDISDIIQQQPVVGVGTSYGLWQVSTFAFVGMIVVISAIVLHFVSESNSGSSNAGPTNGKSRGNSKNGHSLMNHHHRHSGGNSRPHQYRRRQRQRRLQKLRKKKTDEWSDDEEPLQNGARLYSMNDSFAMGGAGGIIDGGYGSLDQPYEYNEYEYEYDNSFD